MVIVNIRGTHGSGKSTVVKSIINRYPTETIAGEKKPDGYRVAVPFIDRPILVVGSYETACGGCDAIQPYALIWPRVEEYAKEGHVLFEGALVSSSYGNIGRDSEKYGDRFVFAFIDTPLEVCLARIAARRKARGDDRPVDPKNTKGKYDGIQKSIPKIKGMGRRIVSIDYRKAVSQVLGLFNGN